MAWGTEPPNVGFHSPRHGGILYKNLSQVVNVLTNIVVLTCFLLYLQKINKTKEKLDY